MHPNKTYEEMPLELEMVKPAQERQGQDKRLLVAVAISGGGERAANFGIGALIGLEDIALNNPKGKNVLAQVDIFSTVSGGGFAAAIYISSLFDFINNGGSPEGYSLVDVIAGLCSQNSDEPEACRLIEKSCCGKDATSLCLETRFDPCARRQLERGYEDDAAGFLNPFVSTSWRIWFGNLDRTNLLEMAIDDDLLAAKWRSKKAGSDNIGGYSLRLRDVFVPINSKDNNVHLPHWIANAATFENGAIFPFTPQHLRTFQIIEYTHRLNKIEFDLKKSLDSREYDEFIFDIPLSLAVTASGNFPVALPATTLKSNFDPNNPYLHLLDGGLADNLGVMSAIRFLQQNDAADVKKLMIVIDAYKGSLGPFSKKEGAPSWSKTASRTANVFLDSWRGRYREIASDLCAKMGAQVVFVSFEDLNDPKYLKELIDLDHSRLANVELTAEDIDALKKKRAKDQSLPPIVADKVTPFDLLRNISTSYNVSTEEQNILIASGRLVIKNQEAVIKKVLSSY